MSYYEDRIKALEARIEEMAKRERFKAIPVEARLIENIIELQEGNARLKAEVERWSVAGELMLDHLNTGWASEHRVIEAIEAAKEGKQP